MWFVVDRCGNFNVAGNQWTAVLHLARLYVRYSLAFKAAARLRRKLRTDDIFVGRVAGDGSTELLIQEES